MVDGNLLAAAVLSGNRNFEGRVHASCKAMYLASPPLVIAYALAGMVDIDLATEPLGVGRDGRPVYLKDVWPSQAEIAAAISQAVNPEMFRRRYADVFEGNEKWNAIAVAGSELYAWDAIEHLHPRAAVSGRFGGGTQPHPADSRAPGCCWRWAIR